MSKKISFADAAVNTVLIMLTIAAAVLSCIYFLRGTPDDSSSAENTVTHIIEPDETQTETTAVTTVTETSATDETTSDTEYSFTPPVGEYDPAFFDDVFFIGDSLSVGLINYEFLKPENIFAQAGITPSSVKKTKIDDMTVYQKAAAFDPKYICIMLGTNGLSYLKTDDMAEKMGSFVDELEKLCPEAKIVIVSIPPVTKKREDEKAEKMDSIVEYNEKLKKLAEDKSVAFADAFTLLQDETGYLGGDYAEHDGLHLKIHAYPVILGAIENAVTEFYGEQPISDETSEATEFHQTAAASENTAETAIPAAVTVQNTSSETTAPTSVSEEALTAVSDEPVSMETENPEASEENSDSIEIEETEILN